MTETEHCPSTVSPRLSFSDEAHLQWYFSLGQTMFERSMLGGVLERAHLYSTDRRWWMAEPEITARPTAELRTIGGYVPDLNVLTRYADVSRQLKKLAEQSEFAPRVLEAYWGDIGGRWAITKQGRAFALYHLTASGQKMLSSVAKKLEGKELNLPLHARMGAQVELQSIQPTESRRQALARIDREAETLYREACRRWNAVRAAAADR